MWEFCRGASDFNDPLSGLLPCAKTKTCSLYPNSCSVTMCPGPHFLAEENPTDSFRGPSFEGAHPPTRGPQSVSGSFEIQRDESPSHPAFPSDGSVDILGSLAPSRSFSRSMSATLCEIDGILTDVGCCDAPHSDSPAPQRACPVGSRGDEAAAGGEDDSTALDDDWEAGPLAAEEALRRDVARALSICAFLPSDVDRLLDLDAGPGPW